MRWVSVAGDGQNRIVTPIARGCVLGGLSLRLLQSPAAMAASLQDSLSPERTQPRRPCLRTGSSWCVFCSLCGHLPVNPLENQSLCSASGWKNLTHI